MGSLVIKPLFLRIIYVFFVLGQSAYNPYAKPRNDGSIIMQYIPSIIFLCISFCVSAFTLIYQMYYAVNYGRTDSIAAFLFVASDSLSNAVVVVQLFMYSRTTRDVYRKFLEVQSYARQKLAIQLDYQMYCYGYLRKIIFMVILYALMCAAKFCIRTSESDFILGQCYCALRLFNMLGKSHALLYVDMLENIVSACYSRVTFVEDKNIPRIIPRNEITKVLNSMKHYKAMHFKLYEISIQINRIFGWSFITLFTECFVDTSYSLYWTFIYAQADSGLVYTCFSNF